MHPLLLETKELLSAAPFDWAVCGGFAIDLFLGRETRPHGDMDLCAFEKDRPAIQRFMLEKGWNVYEFRGMGKVRPLNPSSVSETGRNLMCFLPGCDLVQFYPCEEEGLLYHQFFPNGLTELNYLEFLFTPTDGNALVFSQSPAIHRELDQAILRRDGIPYLAPEIALLHKARDPERPESVADFQAAFPNLDPEQKRWYLDSFRRLYPDRPNV